MTGKDFVEGSYATTWIRLRDDVCNICAGFDKDKKMTPSSFLSKAIEQSKPLNRASIKSGTESLKVGISEGLKSLTILQSTFDSNEFRHSEHQLEKIVTCETFETYISILISLHTTTTADLASSIVPREKMRCDRKRKGSNTSAESQEDAGMNEDASDDSCGSESIQNDFEDDDENEKINGLRHLYEACDFLGSSPCFHPDWLDKTCRLRVGLTKTYALNIAEKLWRN